MRERLNEYEEEEINIPKNIYKQNVKENKELMLKEEEMIKRNEGKFNEQKLNLKMPQEIK